MPRQVSDDDRGPVGAACLRWRRRKGLSLPKAAREIGVPLDTYQAWELGYSKPSTAARVLLRWVGVRLPAKARIEGWKYRGRVAVEKSI